MSRFLDDDDDADRSHSTRWWGILISAIAVGVLKALPQGITVYAPGSDTAIALPNPQG